MINKKGLFNFIRVSEDKVKEILLESKNKPSGTDNIDNNYC